MEIFHSLLILYQVDSKLLLLFGILPPFYNTNAILNRILIIIIIIILKKLTQGLELLTFVDVECLNK